MRLSPVGLGRLSPVALGRLSPVALGRLRPVARGRFWPVALGRLSLVGSLGPVEESAIQLADNPEAHRVEITVDGELAGFTVYVPGEEAWDFVHTEIGEAFGGRGLASRLIQAALDAMRERGIAVLPTCPFVRSFIERHPDYLDLVPPGERARFELPA